MKLKDVYIKGLKLSRLKLFDNRVFSKKYLKIN